MVIAKTSADNTRGVLVCVNCETDFVAKNGDFTTFADTLAQIALDRNIGSIEGLKAAAFNSNGLSVAEKLIEQTGVIGEKIDISACSEVTAAFVYAYNHPVTRWQVLWV